MKTVWRVFAYLRRYPWMTAGTLACAILSTLMVLVFPAVTKRVVDEVLNQHHAERLMPLILTAAAFVLQNDYADGLRWLTMHSSTNTSKDFWNVNARINGGTHRSSRSGNCSQVI
jgi:ABC-type multidrug transport system fused ATPase/permease subunit